jgi:hypothetical protein
LIEALVALAIVATTLSSIGALIATTVRATHAIQSRLDRAAATRMVLAALPERDQIAPGTLTGEIDGHRWRLDISALPNSNIAPPERSLWIPQAVLLTIQSRTAGAITISTVRLKRRGEP